VRTGLRGAKKAGSLVLAACAVLIAGGGLVSVTAALAARARTGTSVVTRVDDRAAGAAVVVYVGLRISLKVSPERVAPGETVDFDLHLAARHAIGALGYRLFFGDGTSRANAIPLYCLHGPGNPASADWKFRYHYAKAGTYKVVVTGFVNCTAARAVARAVVVVT
jgi:hypothetical protein